MRLGHQRIGYLQSADPADAARLRLAGYRRALAEYNIPFEERLVTAVGDQNGYEGAMTLLNNPAPPSALFVFNDRMAMGAYDAIRNLDLQIPDDVAVIGYDNQEFIAPALNPALTTVALPHYEMGFWAVEHLLTLIDQPDKRADAAIQYKTPCPLIERASA